MSLQVEAREELPVSEIPGLRMTFAPHTEPRVISGPGQTLPRDRGAGYPNSQISILKR